MIPRSPSFVYVYRRLPDRALAKQRANPPRCGNFRLGFCYDLSGHKVDPSVAACIPLYDTPSTPHQAHREEENTERLEHLLAKGERNLRFVLRKYRMAEPRRPDALLGEAAGAAPRARTRNTRLRGGEAGEVEDGDRTWTPGR